jgi:hypothetical protein
MTLRIEGSGFRIPQHERQTGRRSAKLAEALVQLAERSETPTALAGADAVGVFEQKAKNLLEDANADRELSSYLDHDDA